MGLDSNKILNVSVAEPPRLPLPQKSRVMYLAMALVVAFVVGTGSDVVSEYMDKSFHTPDDVQRYLNVPVYASLPARQQRLTLTNTEHARAQASVVV